LAQALTTQVASRDMTPRSRSHGHVLYTAKMRHYSLLGGPINFILRLTCGRSPNYLGTNWLPW